MGANPYRNPTISGIREIFETYPQLQNEFSSMWFFFVLFPKQEEGFGPKQLMFSFASKVAKSYGVNGIWQKGMTFNDEDKKEREFMTTAVGWCFDGNEVHEDLVHQPALARISKKGSVKAWVSQKNGEKYGGEIIAPNLNEERLEVYFNGKNGFGKFEVWSEDDWDISKPKNYDTVSKFHSSLLVAWRKFNFKGNFGYNGVEEYLEGYGYFQRVCVNLPTMPWYWPILMFPDGSIYSSFQPFFGLSSFKYDEKLRNKTLRKLRLNLSSTAYYADNTTKEVIEFSDAFVQEVDVEGSNDIFIEAISKNDNTGDYIKVRMKSLGETGFDLEKNLYGYFHSLWNYNEHIVQVVEIKGNIRGKDISNKIRNGKGQIYGNCEYCWGMSV
ncbi:MAG: hypothetical protein ACW99A_01420 [Candidatus Kariarchaeaceae archaeon]|jgi:hypothetical protein